MDQTNVRCPQCQSNVTLSSAAALGQPTVCPVCGTRFTPPAQGQSPFAAGAALSHNPNQGSNPYQAPQSSNPYQAPQTPLTAFVESKQQKEDRSTSIVLFITGLLGCLSPICAVYGIVFLVKRPYAFPLKWMAIAGTVFHCLWSAYLVLVVIMVVLAESRALN